MSENMFSSSNNTDYRSSSNAHGGKYGHEIESVAVDPNALEIPVTDNDIRIQKKVDRLDILARIFVALILIVVIGFVLLLVGTGTYFIKLDKTLFIILFISYFVFFTLFIAGFLITDQIKNDVFKEGIVDPILESLLNYNCNASMFLKKRVSFKKIFKLLDFYYSWSTETISDCIIGEVETTKFAFVDFELSHSGGNKARVIAYKGQMFYFPAARMIPPEFQTSELRGSDKLQKLQETFKEALARNNTKRLNHLDQASVDFYQQYASYSNNYFSKSNREDFGRSDNFNDKSKITLGEIPKLLKVDYPCYLFCTNNQIILFLDSSKDLLETKSSDKTDKIIDIKRRLLKETNWIKEVVCTFRRTGLV